jgi:hypothetical protein
MNPPYPPWLIDTSDLESIKAKMTWNSIMAKAIDAYKELISYGYKPKQVQEILPDALKVITLGFKDLDAMIKFDHRPDLYEEVKFQGYEYVSELVADLYNKQHFNLRQVAERLDVTHVSIAMWMKIWKMPRRPRGKRRSKT